MDLGEDLVYLVQYGSSLFRTTPNDIDLVAVCMNGFTQSIQLGRLDILRVPEKDMKRMVKVLDPVYCTEPYLTGRPIWGDAEAFLELRREILSTIASPAAISHMVLQSSKLLLDSVAETGHWPGNALRNLHFSIGYWSFATWYAGGRRPNTWRVVREESAGQLTNRVRHMVSRCKTGYEPTAEEVMNVQRGWSNLLAKTFTVNSQDREKPRASGMT